MCTVPWPHGLLPTCRSPGATISCPPHAGLKKRLDAAAAVGRGRPAPRVACIQWPDPLFAAGGWVPQLVKMAGARDVLGKVGALAGLF